MQEKKSYQCSSPSKSLLACISCKQRSSVMMIKRNSFGLSSKRRRVGDSQEYRSMARGDGRQSVKAKIFHSHQILTYTRYTNRVHQRGNASGVLNFIPYIAPETMV